MDIDIRSFRPFDDELEHGDDNDLPAIKPVVVPPKPPTGPAMERLLMDAGIDSPIIQRSPKTNTYFVEWHQNAKPAATYSQQLRQALGATISIAREHTYRRMDGTPAFSTVDFSLS